jgi:hypothetical protein
MAFVYTSDIAASNNPRRASHHPSRPGETHRR